jgi:hypothetical protein
MREKQKIFAERHTDTLNACRAAMDGKWDEAGTLFFKAADDPTAKIKKAWPFPCVVGIMRASQA